MKTENKLTRIGILLGSFVPVASTLADFFWSDLSLSFSNLVLLYSRDYLLWIILTTPVAIGGVFYFFAKKVKKHEDELIADRNRNFEELNTLEKFIFDIESGDFTEHQYHFNDQRLATILDSLKSKLVRQKDEDEKTNWVAEGHARMGEIFRSSADLEKLSDEVIKNLVKITQSNQGSVFILDDQNPEKPVLHLTACYAYDRKKYETKTVEPGEGLVGQCYLERDTILLTQVPDHYVKITSGLGEATPSFVAIIPIKANDVIEGVLEIASFHALPKYYLEFLEKVCEAYATVIRSVKVNEATKALLETSQNQTEELRAQEEEMRQNMEELHATQEAMERKTKEADEHANTLKAIFDSSVDAILTTNENGIVDTCNKAAIELFQYPGEELIGNTIQRLLSGTEGTAGQTVVAEGRRKDGTLFPIELMVNEAFVADRKIKTHIIHDITQRARVEKIKQEQLEALKVREEELRQNKEELQAIQEQMAEQLVETRDMKDIAEIREMVLGLTSILSETDLRGVITYVNTKFCEVAKYRADELIGKPQNIVRHPDMPKELFRLLWGTLREGSVFSGIIKNKAKDGSAYWVDATIVPIKDRHGKIVKYIGARYHIKNESTAIELYNKQADQHHWPRLHAHEFLHH